MNEQAYVPEELKTFLGRPVERGQVVTWATYANGSIDTRIGVVTKVDDRGEIYTGRRVVKVQVRPVAPNVPDKPWRKVPDLRLPLKPDRAVSIKNINQLVVLTSYPSALHKFREEVLDGQS